MMFQQAREKVVATCLDLADRGFLAGTGGNIALRADRKHFLVTPSATDYYTMTAADICVLRIADRVQVEGVRAASVEAGLHANVLQARPDCEASIHTHQPVASAFTLLAIALEINDKNAAMELGSSVPCVTYAPSGTGWLARQVGRVFQETGNACLMRNHGVVCVGKDIPEAIRRVVLLEAACAEFFREGLVEGSRISAATVRLVERTLMSMAQSCS